MKLSLLESKIFGKVCYGFRRDKNKRIEIVEHEAKIVREIFALCLSGNSLEKIQEHLRKQGIPSPSGKAMWSRDVLNKLLNNYKYTFGVIDHATYFAVEEVKSNRCKNPNWNIEDDEEWNEQVNLSYYGPTR
ncbi:recombinase family protein [Neglectibacter caecimuris]|uniref:recombinase family protein n=1 Tax=Neglectibacter caecimuris TaxID=3093658 RepID=UPI002AC92D49|nr:recombinase family protein [Neglectibacter sp. M00184]